MPDPHALILVASKHLQDFVSIQIEVFGEVFDLNRAKALEIPYRSTVFKGNQLVRPA